MATIKFGTSGWRDIIARDFTFDNVRVATQGIADYLKSELASKTSPIYGRKPVVILGHDTRFLGQEFSLAAAEILAASGIEPLLCDRGHAHAGDCPHHSSSPRHWRHQHDGQP